MPIVCSQTSLNPNRHGRGVDYCGMMCPCHFLQHVQYLFVGNEMKRICHLFF
jgi:hypothetical protein